MNVTRPGRYGLLLLAVMLVAGCRGSAAIRMAAEDAAQQEEIKARAPGEQLVKGADDVKPELGCSERRPVRARIDKGEVIPVRPAPGREINHRIVYSACGGAEQLTGTMTRRLYYGRQVLMESKEPLTLKPGRWTLDVFVGIPPQTEPGWYRTEAVFEVTTPYLYLRDRQDFQVVRAKP